MDISLSDFIDVTYDMIFVIDKSGSIKFANKSAEENLLYSKEEFLSMNLNQILYESEKIIEILDRIVYSANDDLEKDDINQTADLTLIKEELGFQDMILISKDTKLKIIYANFQARKLLINGEEIILLILRDITERKYFEQKLIDMNEHLEILVQEKTIELQKKNEMLEKLATTDTLTNLLNIRKFREILKYEIDKINRSKTGLKMETFVIVMIDADHFKFFNDNYGHQVGDEIIKGIARILNKSVRNIDIVARYGGDEFIILLNESDEATALKVCLRIRELLKKDSKIEKTIREITGVPEFVIPRDHKITLSMGVSKLKTGDTMDEIIRNADMALYSSKENGRNCIHINTANSIKKITEKTFDPDDFLVRA